MGVDPTRVLRGALAGAAAAGVWAAQQPLDKRVFGVDYDDVELLGSIITRERGTVPTFAIGTAMHLANGALFGAAYAAASAAVPGPAVARGMAAAMAENVATWPLTAFVGRAHPVGRTFPKLFGDRRAFAQATWRHLLFGAVLGVVEDQLNPPVVEAAPAGEENASSNGHGNLAHVVVTSA
jgi:hypothetical protein